MIMFLEEYTQASHDYAHGAGSLVQALADHSRNEGQHSVRSRGKIGCILQMNEFSLSI